MLTLTSRSERLTARIIVGDVTKLFEFPIDYGDDTHKFGERDEIAYTLIGGVDIEDRPVTRVQRYLAYLAGIVDSYPQHPITRKETYLAKICGADVVIPKPYLRSEFYLAALCGEDVNVPEPITTMEYLYTAWINKGVNT